MVSTQRRQGNVVSRCNTNYWCYVVLWSINVPSKFPRPFVHGSGAKVPWFRWFWS